MPIIVYLGRNVKEYKEKSGDIIEEMLEKAALLCEKCLQPMKRHSSYERGIKETGEKLRILMVWCKACEEWHALLPDFLLPGKHYSGNEIESVIIEAETEAVSGIETEASEATARRWIGQIGERVKRAIGILKYLFGRNGKAMSEAAITLGARYNELEQILELAPKTIKYSGNKLGLANLWLGTSGLKAYI